MFSLIIEGGGGPSNDRENSLFFFFFFNEPFPYLIHCHSSNKNGGISPGEENFSCHLCPITWEVRGQDQVSQHKTPTMFGIPTGTEDFILGLTILTLTGGRKGLGRLSFLESI